MSQRPAPLPHGDLTEIFPDVFFVTGGIRFMPGVIGTRNMTVVRQGGDLVVINSVRLDAEGEAKLDALGKVKHVVRVGFFHGLDDPYYVERYGAQLWVPPRVEAPGAKVLGRDGCPVEGAPVFVFEKGKEGEVALVLPRDGGVLVTCDSYQNWTTFEGCTFLCRLMLGAMGFGPRIVGGPWVKRMGAAVREDFHRLLQLPFVHLAPAHGTVIRDGAKEGLREAIAKRFGA